MANLGEHALCQLNQGWPAIWTASMCPWLEPARSPVAEEGYAECAEHFSLAKRLKSNRCNQWENSRPKWSEKSAINHNVVWVLVRRFSSIDTASPLEVALHCFDNRMIQTSPLSGCTRLQFAGSCIRWRRLSTIASGEVAAGGSVVCRMRRAQKLGKAAYPTSVSNENAV